MLGEDALEGLKISVLFCEERGGRIVQIAWKCSQESGPLKGLACDLPPRPELRRSN